MWLHLTLLLFVGVAVAKHEFAWETGYEYEYHLQSQTLTRLNKGSNQSAGVYMRGVLVVQAISPNILHAKIDKPEYASVYTTLVDGWDFDNPDEHLEYMPMPLSGKTFEIRAKNGTVKLLVQKDVHLYHNWEVNIIKSVVSQLQVDTLGENIIVNINHELPENDFPLGYFTAMEDTVGGKCEVFYDIMEVPEKNNSYIPDLDDDHLIDITKTKNYTNCEEQMNYHFGSNARANWDSVYNNNDQFLSRHTHSHINIMGELKRFTIISSETTNEIYVGSTISEDYTGSVYNKMNLTLYGGDKINHHLPVPKNLVSMKNLVYEYRNPDPHKSTDNLSSSLTQSDSPRSIVSNKEKPYALRGENRDHMQPTPEMNKSPHGSSLSYFDSYMGMKIQQSDKINFVGKAKDIIDQINKELTNPNDIPVKNTLEKFLNLIELIQFMSYQEIIELENSLYLSPNQIKNSNNDKKNNYWHILRDAVTQTGTEPALKVIMHWVHEDLLKGKEAADVLSKIPRTAFLVTDSYVETFFDLIRHEKIMQQKFLNETAPLAFAELVHYTYVSKHSHHIDSQHNFDPTISHQSFLLLRCISYMSTKLRESVDEGDSTRIQTYIVALGNIAHPFILRIFDSYWDGTFEVSKFQRFMMISALGKLAEVYPDDVRNVLYRMYLNTSEPYEFRIMAVYLFMKTNPSLTMLKHMAKNTNNDKQKQVTSAVKSIIKSYAKLKGKQWEDISEKARYVEKLLNTEEYDNASYGYITESTKYINKFLNRFIYNTIGSEDHVIPKALYINLVSSYNYIKYYDIEFKYMVSSVKKFFQAIEAKHKPKDKDSYKNVIENITRILNIQSDNDEQLEGNVFLDDQYGFKFLPFDNNTISSHIKDIQDYIESLKHGKYININNMENKHIVLATPTETGLPFVATLDIPKLFKVNGDLEAEQKDDGNIFKMEASLSTVYSEKVQGRLGFTLPFKKASFVTGVDTSKQLYLPAKFKFEVDTKNKTIQFKVQPIVDAAPDIKLLHYSVKPYLSRLNILDFQPMSDNKDTHLVRQNKPYKDSYSLASGLITIHLEGNGYYNETSNGLNWENYLQKFVKYLYCDDYGYKKVDVHLQSTFGLLKNNWFGFSTAYDTAEVDTDVLEHEESRTRKINITVATDKQPLSPIRRERFMQELGKGIKSAKVHVLDVALEIPTQTSQNRQVLTLGLANSNVEKQSRSLFYWNIQSMKSDEVYLEACGAGQVQSSQDILLDFEQTIRSEPKDEFDGALRYGKNCMDGKTISMKGKQTRTNERKVAVLQSKTARKCQEEMKKDNKGLRACELASKLAVKQNYFEISVDVDPTLRNTYLNEAVQSVNDKIAHDSTMELLKPKNTYNNSFKAKVEASPDFKQVQVSLYTPEMNVTSPWQDISSLKLSLSEDEPDRLMEEEASCTLDKKRAVTFDDMSYPLHLGKCWHVMMITSRQENNPENPDEMTMTLSILTMSQNREVLVLVREMDDNSKQVRMFLGDNEIYLEQLNEQKLQAKVDGQIVRHSQDVSYQHKEDNQTIFEMFELLDGSIRLLSTKYELNAVYDGYRLRVEVSNAYRNTVRGLCGNYDRKSDNDFMTPRKCLMNKAEEFSATYALLQDDCQGPAKVNAQKAEQRNCNSYLRTRQAYVINNKEAGSEMRENEKQKLENANTQQKDCTSYRTMLVHRNGEICFTVRPVPMCMKDCKPTKMKMKSYSLHCMPDNETSRQLQNKIEQGANPDMSQRSVSMMYNFEIPVACNAA